MPITVKVRSGATSGGEPPALTFDGTRVVLGRGSGADVRLPDTSVSVRHASIRSNGSEYSIVDEGSTNGTFVGGVRLYPQSPRVLRSGDLVRLGRVWVEIVVGQAAPTYDLALATRDIALALVARAMGASGSDTAPVVSVVEGPDLGAELRLEEEGRAYTLGRAESCDLPLADPDASREHAQVVRRGNQVLLRDLGSRNGVLLADAPLPPQRDVPWKGAAMVRIGVSVLSVREPVVAALAELESADDEPFDGTPPEPPRPEGQAPEGEAEEPAPEPPPSAAAPGAVAPIASLPSAAAAAPPRRKRGWSVTDVLVIVLAVGVIGASAAGLYWLLRG